VVLNLMLVVVLTPIFNALDKPGPSLDATVSADYRI
jgi:hypothetical protein